MVPVDNGVAFFDFKDGIPFCRRCTDDYPADKVNDFNAYYNRCCPVAYNSDKSKLCPVNWKEYRNTEYDIDFNIPMGIGHSLGCGFANDSLGAIHVLVLNRSRHSGPFSDKEEKESDIDRMIRKVEFLPGNIPLSRREAIVCQMLCRRLSIREIADLLHNSPRTIECHCLHIYQKLNVSNRMKLARLLVR